MTAALACIVCGTDLRASAKFCDACGTPVARMGLPAEYKQVTVLFADVVRSMDVAASVGAERLREIMTDLVNRSAAVVQRYGGTLDKFTGDGVMAVFGAPAALEDHALRGCLAALGIQDEAKCLAAEVGHQDGVDLSLRIGLNSGQVIAGEIGSGSLAYTAVGEEVGRARRMESIAPPGAVMLSASTARLVEGKAILGDSERIQLKGGQNWVVARRLLGVGAKRHRISESALVGRKSELTALKAALDRSIAGRGSVVGLAGPAGIGKTRLAGEILQLARSLGVTVFSTFCESHAADVPFGVAARLLRAVGRINGLDDQRARARMREQITDADPQDMLLLDDLLGIADPNVALPKIAPDARRRRLVALIAASQLACTRPAVLLVEDAHWIDAVSESMLADFLAVTPQTRWLVLVTYRPEYQGPLRHVAGAKSMSLGLLSNTETVALVGQLLGWDPSVGEIAEIIAERAAGNPFFAEEITRELAERCILDGDAGCHLCAETAVEVRVPATLQATIAARIDRLRPAAKRMLSAAAVIGYSFDPDLLAVFGIDASVEELIAADLVDRVHFNEGPEYTFRHPLVRTVAYESQLKSDRARLHRQLAVAIEARECDSADSKAALIAEHLAAAGDLRAAFGWHMRAAAWATNRDIMTARRSWERAQEIADALPADTTDRAAMRIAPRTMLCGIALRLPTKVAGRRFNELRELCTASGDNASLAIAMAGLVAEHALRNRLPQASQLASEAMGLAESLAEPTLTVGLSAPLFYAKVENAEWDVLLQWSQRVIDLADGDPHKGNFIIGSPLAVALGARAVARWHLGRPGWRTDLHRCLAMGRSSDPESYAMVITAYLGGISNGVLRSDDSAISEIENALGIAERSCNDSALTVIRATLGLALVHHQAATMRHRGQKMLTELCQRKGCGVADLFLRKGYGVSNSPIVEVSLLRERARGGERDETIPLMRRVVERLFLEERSPAWSAAATAVLVETLLERGAGSDVVEAKAASARLLAAPGDGSRVRDVWLLRLSALLAGAHGDQAAYRKSVDRYRALAKSLNYEGHIVWADAMGRTRSRKASADCPGTAAGLGTQSLID
jgi:class 3 adenylate cyclase